MRHTLIWCLFILTLRLHGWALDQDAKGFHWDLGQVSSDADLSPDDRFLAVSVESTEAVKNEREQVTESVEIWDYRQHRRIAKASLATYLPSQQPRNPVRFSSDGSVLVAAGPSKLHVLDAATLQSLRVIELPMSSAFKITALETSPRAHVAVVICSDNYPSAVMFLYELDTGILLYRWKSTRPIRSVAWSEDGTLLAVAEPSCSRCCGVIQVFDAKQWHPLKTIEVKNPYALAFSGDRLYVVGLGQSKGSVFHRDLGMEVLDVHAWDRRSMVFLPHRDIHDSISFANGRLLASTGQLRVEHNWLDGTAWGVETNVQFTLWKGDSLTPEFESQPFPAALNLFAAHMRLSRSGKMVLLNPRHPQILEIE